jgi:hypothetical protein
VSDRRAKIAAETSIGLPRRIATKWGKSGRRLGWGEGLDTGVAPELNFGFRTRA